VRIGHGYDVHAFCEGSFITLCGVKIPHHKLLREVMHLLAAKNLVCHNADITIVAQSPKMAPHIESMRALVAEDLGVEIDWVNVKATTSEWLGFTGREEGIAANAVVTLVEGANPQAH